MAAEGGAGGSGAEGSGNGPQRHVLDASALFSGKPLPPGGAFVPESVVREVEGRGRDRRALEYLLEAGLRVTHPGRDALARVDATARGTGDAGRLSQADRDILAVALDLDARILTDDYSIQNVARVLGVPFGTISQRGIRDVWTWLYRCTGCRRILDAPAEECPVCGSPVKTVRKRDGASKGPRRK